eukprot:scaffold157847_cov19-Prasinocladus_malaysianus.AAC.1
MHAEEDNGGRGGVFDDFCPFGDRSCATGSTHPSPPHIFCPAAVSLNPGHSLGHKGVRLELNRLMARR